MGTPRLDAEVLIAAALGLPRLQLYVQFDRPLAPLELTKIREAVQRRQAGESVAYIVGKKEFFGLDFAVDARVLVPRPDTETLVDEALGRLRPRPPEPAEPVASEDSQRLAEPSEEGSEEGSEERSEEPSEKPSEKPSEEPSSPQSQSARSQSGEVEGGSAATIPDGAADANVAAAVDAGLAPEPPAPPRKLADVGTGSGAIIVTLGKQLPGAALYAVDASEDALAVARANAERHGVAVTFLAGDLGLPLAPFAPFDLITANLPYIPTGDLPALAPEVRAEPRLALDGGADGLALVQRLIQQAPPLLAPGGALVLEIGAGQSTATAALLRAAGFIDVRMRRDLGAIDRVVSGVKP